MFPSAAPVRRSGSIARHSARSREAVMTKSCSPPTLLRAAIDITERKRAEDELRRTQTFFNTIIENVPLPIVVKSVPSEVEDARECRFTLIMRAAGNIFGFSRDKMIGKNAREFYSRDQADFVVRYDNEALRADHPILVGDDTIKTSNTDIRNVTARKVAIRDDDGKPKYLLSLLEDVTERRRTEQHIVHMAHYDLSLIHI